MDIMLVDLEKLRIPNVFSWGLEGLSLWLLIKEIGNYNITLIESTIAHTISGVIGVIFGSYLTYAEAFIIHEWCPFCVVAFVLTIAATFFCITEYGSDIKELINKNGIEEEA